MIKFLTLNSIERNTLLILLVWTGIFAFSLWVNINQEKEAVIQLATSEIRRNFEDIDTFRKWIARQGGVYVSISKNIIPNPSLEHMPERDITTVSGQHFTLINTPYLLKQLSTSNQSSFNAHMTSLNPLNPANKADEWEQKALLSFNNGNDESCEIVDYKDEKHMRLIRPAKYETKCAACHFDKPYKMGDALGGLTVSVPMQPYYDNAQIIINKLFITHSALWFLGLSGIGLVYRNQKKHEIKRRQNEDYLRQSGVAFNNLNEGLIITDLSMKIIAINNAFTKITGFNKDELIGKNPAFLKSDFHGHHNYSEMIKTLNNHRQWVGEIQFIDQNNVSIPINLSVNAVYDNEDKLTNYIFVYSDIRERKYFEETLEHLAQHDHLTDLPNRLLLNDRLKQAVIRADRDKNRIAILFLDLDHFKNINDSLGHHTGDTVLIQVTQRLKDVIRKGDTLARLGGDEFVIVMEKVASNKDVTILAKKLISSLKPGFILNNQKYYLGVSIGISLFPEHGKSESDLISNADIAMYKAKADGRNDFKFYTPELNADFRDKVKIETDLRRAIKNDEFVLHYQPQVSIEGNNIVGVECLVRWQHPEYGLVYPDDFIHTAEEIDLMVPIGEIIINKACAQMNKWLTNGIDISVMAINISGKQIASKKLHEHITNALDKYNISPNRLELEVTENYIMNQDEQSIRNLEKLRDSSVQISIDDFGTGYSSLNYLKMLPIDKIKIDRSFVNDIPADPHDKAIINAVIAIGKSLNFKVVAEGVENPQQLDFLQREGCDEYQGFYCSKALPADEFDSMYRDRQKIAV